MGKSVPVGEASADPLIPEANAGPYEGMGHPSQSKSALAKVVHVFAFKKDVS